MIGIRLTGEDVAGIRIVDTADFSAELFRAGYLLATGGRSARLDSWRRDLGRGWNPGIARLFDLYSPSVLPGVFDGSVHPDPAATATAVEATDPDRLADYIRTLSRTRPVTEFVRSLAEGQAQAYASLGRAVADLQAVALDPYRRRISAATAAAAAQARARAAKSGPDVMLRSLHPGVRWERSMLILETVSTAEVELDGRTLVLSPSVFSIRPGHSGDMFHDRLVVYYPASHSPLVRDPGTQEPGPSLVALLGATRAAALSVVIGAPGLTTGGLATALGVSASTASEHAAVLREARLITTFREGMSVHHQATRLGLELADILGGQYVG
ncbi:helix-turn-helix domain-containing protein [Catenulispora yoronensis]|uniref:ArsR/SmtB family transcription factor n=1 Tax=Catenulispora yoronensis TaxID=450799 RepID=UPI0031D7FAAB